MHRLVRISPFDSAARRHTSFASLYVWLNFRRTSTSRWTKDLRVDTYRSAWRRRSARQRDRLRHPHPHPDRHRRVCQNERSQHKNRASAIKKVLKARLYDLKMKEQQAKLEQIGGEKQQIAFGSQIRSHVPIPYQMVQGPPDERVDG